MGSTEIKRLRIWVKQDGAGPKVCNLHVPVGAGMEDLHAAVSDVVLGPEEDRWTKVKEEVKEELDPDHGGGTITTTSTFEAQALKLWTHPHDDCAPLDNNLDLAEIPPALDVYSLLVPGASPSTEVEDDASLRAWWAEMPKGRNVLRPLAVTRLVSKVSVPKAYTVPYMETSGGVEFEAFRDEPVVPHIREAFMLQGVQGLLELSADKGHALRLPTAALQAIVSALRCGLPSVMEVAAAAVWTLVALAGPRTALIKLDVVPALVVAAQQASGWRQQQPGVNLSGIWVGGGSTGAGDTPLPAGASLETSNRVVFNCLGALSILAIDGEARLKALEVSPRLAFLSELASLDFPTPDPPVLDSQPTSPRPAAEGEAGTEGSNSLPADQGVAEAKPAADTVAGSQAHVAEPAAGAQQEGDAARGVGPPEGHDSSGGTGGAQPEDGEDEQQPWVLPDEDSPAVHQRIASEILWTMVGRDVDVRRSLAMHGGLADLLRLTHSSNGDVGAVAVMCLAAYARDVSTSAAPTSPPPGAQGQPDPSSTAEQPGGAGADTSSAIKRDSVSGSVQGSTLGGGSTAHPGAGATSTSSTPLPSAPAPPPPERKIGGGASLLLDSGESLGVVQELMGLMGDLLGLYSSGVDLLGSGGHSLLEVMECGAAALWGAVSAQLVGEEEMAAEAARRAAEPPPPPTPKPTTPSGTSSNFAAIAAAMEAKMGAKKAQEPPKPKGPKGVLTYRDASHLARLAGQLVALLQDAQIEEAHPGARSRSGLDAGSHSSSFSGRNSTRSSSHAGAQEGDEAHSRASGAAAGSHARPAPSVKSTASKKQPRTGLQKGQSSLGRNKMTGHNAGAGHAAYSVHAGGSSQGSELPPGSSPTGRPPSSWLAASLYSVLTSLALLHESPLLLGRTHASLMSLNMAAIAARSKAEHAKHALETQEAEVAAKRLHHKFYYEDDDAAETDRLEHACILAEREVEVAEEELYEAEEALQAGCEETLAAVQDALRCLQPTQVAVGYVQLAAAAAVGAMAQATHPAQTATLQDPSPAFTGPFRALLGESDVLGDLMSLARSPCCGDPALAHSTRLVVASCLTHLLATEQPSLQAAQLAGVLLYLDDEVQPLAVHQHLAAIMWCICRHEANRRVLLSDSRWVELLKRWVSGGMHVLRRHHMAVHGAAGFYQAPIPTPEQGSGGHREGAGSATRSTPVQSTGSQGGSRAPTSTSAPGARSSPAASNAARHGPARTSGATGSGATSPSEMAGGSTTAGGSGAAAGAQFPGPVAVSGEGAEGAAGPHYTRATGVAAARQVRFSVMSLWMMLRQWLVENLSPMNTLTTADGLYVRSSTSFWSLRFTIDTPLPLTGTALEGLALLSEAAATLPDVSGSLSAGVRELALRSAWNLSVAHPVIAARLVQLGLANLLLATAVSPSAGSTLVQVAVHYMMHLVDTPEHVTALGGLTQVASLLVSVIQRSLGSAPPGSAGVGADVEMMEAAVRGLARMGLSPAGRAALKACKAVKALVAVVRADSDALEAVLTARQAAGVSGYEMPEELVAPLRAINALPIKLAPEQAKSARDIAARALAAEEAVMPPEPAPSEPATSTSPSRTPSTRVAEGGAAWGRPPWADQQQQGAGGSGPQAGAQWGGAGGGGSFIRSRPSDVAHDKFVRAHGIDRDSILQRAHAAEAAAAAAQDSDQGVHDHPHTSTHTHPGEPPSVGGDADVGLMALWGLLNLSGYEPAQVSLCRHGLYTLLRAVHRSADPLRSSTAAAILANIHFHPDNATTLYKAELKLKYAALLHLHGAPAMHRVNFHRPPPRLVELQTKASQGPGGMRPASASPSALRFQQHHEEEEGAGGVALQRAPTSLRATTQLAAAALNQGIEALKVLSGGGGAEGEPGSPSSPAGHRLPSPSPTAAAAGTAGVEPGLEAEVRAQMAAEKATMEARVSFLKWVLDPGAHSYGPLDELQMQSWDEARAMSRDQLWDRLTVDPEEADWLARLEEQAAELEGFQDSRHAQGTFLRGTLSRSLAEGAASLWHGRSGSKAKKEEAAAAGGGSLGAMGGAMLGRPGSPASSASALPPRPSTASPRTRPMTPPSPSSAVRSSISGAQARGSNAGTQQQQQQQSPGSSPQAVPPPIPATSPRPGTAGPPSPAAAAPPRSQRPQTAVSRSSLRSSTGQPARPASSRRASNLSKSQPNMAGTARPPPLHGRGHPGPHGPHFFGMGHSFDYGKVNADTQTNSKAKGLDPRAQIDKPGCEAWRPHVLAFLQDKKYTQPQVFLAQRLLTAGVPPAVTDRLADLSAKLFGNQVLTDGIKAMEERAAAEAAFRAAVEAAAKEERERMEAEARVLDLVVFEDHASGKSVRAGGSLSRAMSRKVSMAVGRAAERGLAFAASRAVSRALSRTVSRAASRAASRQHSRAMSRALSRRPSHGQQHEGEEEEGGAPSEGAGTLGGGEGTSHHRRRPRSAAAGGVRFGAAVPPAPGEGSERGSEDGVAEVLAAAASVFRSSSPDGSGGGGDDLSQDHETPAQRGGRGGTAEEGGDDNPGGGTGATTAGGGQGPRDTPSFIAASLIPAGSLSSFVPPSPPPPQPLSRQASLTLRRSSSLVRAGPGVKPPVPTASINGRGSLTRGGGGSIEAAAARAVAATTPGVLQSVTVHTANPAGAQRGAAAAVRQHQQIAVMAVPEGGGRPRLGPGSGTLPHSDSLTSSSMGGKEGKWLGVDVQVALERPASGYWSPHVGLASPPGTRVASLKSERQRALLELLQPDKAMKLREPRLGDDIPRPTTVLASSVEDVITLKALRDGLTGANAFQAEQLGKEAAATEAGIQGTTPLAIKVATGDGGPDKIYHFPRDTLYDPRHMVMFEHIEGAHYCEPLFGHYLLPNGRLAHFVLGDTVRKGHKVDLIPPPVIPFTSADWLPDQLPTSAAFTPYTTPGSRTTSHLLAPMWCPVPSLAPPPAVRVLEWEDDDAGGGSGPAPRADGKPAGLALRTVCLAATLHTVTRSVTDVVVVEPKPKPKKKKAKGGPGAAAGAGRGGAAPRPTSPAKAG